MLFLGDQLTWATLVGGALIVAGIWIIIRDQPTADHVVAGTESLT